MGSQARRKRRARSTQNSPRSAPRAVGAAAQSHTKTPSPLTLPLVLPWCWLHRPEPKPLLVLFAPDLLFSYRKPVLGLPAVSPPGSRSRVCSYWTRARFFGMFVATFRPEVQGEGSTLCASCPGELGAGTSGAGGKIHLSAGFSLDPSLDLIRHSSW